MKGNTNPSRCPRRAVVLARERSKCRQGRMRAGSLIDEMRAVRRAEIVHRTEGKTARTAWVRSGRAPRCRRAPARMNVQARDVGDLSVATAHCAVIVQVNSGFRPTMHGAEEADRLIAVRKRSSKAREAAWRSRWSEGVGATGAGPREGKAGAGHTAATCSGGEALLGAARATGAEGVTAVRAGAPSKPERGAGCPGDRV